MTAAKLCFMKLVVRDLAVMTRFYETAFDLKQFDAVLTDDFEEALLRQPGNDFMLALFRYKDGRMAGEPTAHGPTGFLTDDLEASIERVVAAGATLKVGPFEVGPSRVAFLDDPEGHEMEFVQFV